MLQNAVHMEEICKPVSLPSVGDVLTAEKIVELKQNALAGVSIFRNQ